TVTLEWHHNGRFDSDDIIDRSHLGPVLAYLAPYESDGVGNVWFKIYEDGYNNGQWAVEKLIANRGKVDIKIPKTIKPGRYILRGEIIALHESDTDYSLNPARGAQYYREYILLAYYNHHCARNINR